jgi:hypothetical protein
MGPLIAGPGVAMNEHEILQSFRHNSDGAWTPLRTVAVAGVTMEPGVVFSRGMLFSGIDVAAFLDDLATSYPLSVRS